MIKFDELVDKHYGFGGIMEKIEDGLKLAGRDINSLTVDDLASIDEFHTRGRESTLEVAELTNLQASDFVLDVGCGLGGTARHLAGLYRCNVVGIDLTEEYISVGNRLTELVGLSDRVKLRQASALEIPYEDERFDIVWTEHVQMNIADKNLFYSEIARVLKPGGRLLFHDIFRGFGDSPFYPAPWAEDESISALATEAEARSIMERVGLEIDQWIEKVRESIDFFERVSAQIEADGPPPIGIHLLMGDNAKDKLQNYVRNLIENRLSVALGMALKK
ncbi:MAG: methyltransferase domain-containing protein [Candidatus Krumholzibacteria bacterium]|nr:methyltransferase domain-containing protein [Candidatus Krumholzibacteria bacterium]MCK5619907.1 methyltransferase domain-containing protein [Candidatus Krumholzibacteria bacterium]